MVMENAVLQVLLVLAASKVCPVLLVLLVTQVRTVKPVCKVLLVCPAQAALAVNVASLANVDLSDPLDLLVNAVLSV